MISIKSRLGVSAQAYAHHHAGRHPHKYFLGILTSKLSYIAVIYSLESNSLFFLKKKL